MKVASVRFATARAQSWGAVRKEERKEEIVRFATPFVVVRADQHLDPEASSWHTHRLAGTGRAVQENALRWVDTEVHKALRLRGETEVSEGKATK